MPHRSAKTARRWSNAVLRSTLAAELLLSGCAADVWIPEPGQSKTYFETNKARCRSAGDDGHAETYDSCIRAAGFVSADTKTLAAVQTRFDRVKAVINERRACVEQIRGKLRYVDLFPHLSDEETKKFSEAQLADSRLATDQEKEELIAYSDEVRFCRDRARRQIAQIVPSAESLMVQEEQASDAAVLLLLHGLLTWGQFAEKETRLRQDFGRRFNQISLLY